MTELQHLLRRKKRTGDWNVGDNQKTKLDKAMTTVNYLTGRGIDYDKAVKVAAHDLDVNVDDLSEHINYYDKRSRD